MGGAVAEGATAESDAFEFQAAVGEGVDPSPPAASSADPGIGEEAPGAVGGAPAEGIVTEPGAAEGPAGALGDPPVEGVAGDSDEGEPTAVGEGSEPTPSPLPVVGG